MGRPGSEARRQGFYADSPRLLVCEFRLYVSIVVCLARDLGAAELGGSRAVWTHLLRGPGSRGPGAGRSCSAAPLCLGGLRAVRGPRGPGLWSSRLGQSRCSGARRMGKSRDAFGTGGMGRCAGRFCPGGQGWCRFISKDRLVCPRARSCPDATN